MTYAANQKIQASDFNGLIGTGTTANAFNTVWSTGSSTAGYGQTALSSVTAGTKVAASDWASLVTKVANVAAHQGTAVTSLTAPVSGGKISYLSALPINIQSIYSSRNNAAAQGTTSATTTTNSSTWNQAITFTHTVTFASGDAARYFFNAGGQIKLTFSHPTGGGVDALYSALASACGTVVLSAPSTGTVTIAGTSYNGVTKIGGLGTTSVLTQNVGYYGLTSTFQNIFQQLATGSPTGYVGSLISVSAKTNGSTGSNGDNGSVITFTTLWDEVPDGGSTLPLSSGSTTTVTVVPPASTYITSTWGTPTVSGSVTGA